MWTRRTALRKSLLAWCQHLNPPSKLLPLHLPSLTLTVPARKTGPQLATRVRESQRVFSLARSAVGESFLCLWISTHYIWSNPACLSCIYFKRQLRTVLFQRFLSSCTYVRLYTILYSSYSYLSKIRERILLSVLSISDLQYSFSEILKVIFLSPQCLYYHHN